MLPLQWWICQVLKVVRVPLAHREKRSAKIAALITGTANPKYRSDAHSVTKPSRIENFGLQQTDSE